MAFLVLLATHYRLFASNGSAGPSHQTAACSTTVCGSESSVSPPHARCGPGGRHRHRRRKPWKPPPTTHRAIRSACSSQPLRRRSTRNAIWWVLIYSPIHSAYWPCDNPHFAFTGRPSRPFSGVLVTRQNKSFAAYAPFVALACPALQPTTAGFAGRHQHGDPDPLPNLPGCVPRNAGQLRLRRFRKGTLRQLAGAFITLETLLEERPDQQMAMAMPEKPPAEGTDLPVLPGGKNNPAETEPSVPAPPSRRFVPRKPGLRSPASSCYVTASRRSPDDSADLLIESFQRYRPAPSAAPWPSDKAESSQPEAAQPSDGRHRSDPANAPDDTATDDTLSAPSDTSLTGQVETPAAEALADSADGAQRSSPQTGPNCIRE